MPIKSFRGLLADNANETISLHTNDGSTGYRIKKFEIIAQKPGNVHNESVVKIYSIPQSSVDAFIDFSDNTLLAAGYYRDDASRVYSQSDTVVFDNMTFNQDIYITHVDVEVGESINYYIELEKIKLDLSENTVATLKDIRNIEEQYF
tara:strand:+ start:40 stop:483 length:444 start_codon:yes stop_codon:yes gene_type:complete